MILAPAGTPKPMVSRLYAAFKSTMELADVQDQIIKLGMVPVQSDAPEALQGYINTEMTRWGKVVQQAGLAGSEG